jgi:hypothetical protein
MPNTKLTTIAEAEADDRTMLKNEVPKARHSLRAMET